MKAILTVCSIGLALLLHIGVFPTTAHAQPDPKMYLRGTVVQTYEKTNNDSINGDVSYWAQIRTSDNTIIEAENELGVIETGDKVVIRKETVPDIDSGLEHDVYSIYERDRTRPLIILAAVFAMCVLLLGFRQGIRALSALTGTLFVIFGIYIPSLLAGLSPITVSILMGLLVAGCAVFITHGFRRLTLLAYTSTLLSVLVAIGVAVLTISASGLTGFTSDEAVFLAATSASSFDFAGIMIGGIIIAMLGVLDDIAITQVAVVDELKKSRPTASKRELYTAALRVGRDHAGALVNTLVLAYTGASLPLLLLLQSQNLDPLVVINQEQFAFEIIRSLSGSIGLIACVPIATLLAVYYSNPNNQKKDVHNHDGCPGCLAKLSGERDCSNSV